MRSPGTPLPEATIPDRNTRRYIIAELAAWALRRRRRVIVAGASMVPTLEPGWFVLVDPSMRGTPGDVIVAQHPHDPGLVLIKRFARREADDAVWLSSDNGAAGSDSRQFGPIAPGLVAGRVTLVLDELQRPLRYTPADARRDRRV